MATSMIEQQFEVKIPEEMSPEAYDLINRFLDDNPHTRLGSQGSEEIKNHPFFNGIVWNDLQNAVKER